MLRTQKFASEREVIDKLLNFTNPVNDRVGRVVFAYQEVLRQIVLRVCASDMISA